MKEEQLREILVPIDFSESSVKALRHASRLADDGRSEIILLNVIEEPASFRTLDVVGQQRARHGNSSGRMQHLAQAEVGGGVSVRIIVREGEPSAEISRVAAEHHANLIVLGRHEHRGLRKFFHGHTATGVANSAPCPVLILDSDFPTPTPRKTAA